ncbi:MAG: 50S ribosomal protein L21 [Alphaproteobacteria bacterium]|nr:50S ribosomal protein L21 [Alphaproteobacteria bacterium]
MFAILRIGGKQYKVQNGDKIKVEKMDGQAGDNVSLPEVLFIGGEKDSKLGAPFVTGASATATILEQTRAPKITIFKKKRRQNYRRKNGHKQPLTILQITGIKAA